MALSFESSHCSFVSEYFTVFVLQIAVLWLVLEVLDCALFFTPALSLSIFDFMCLQDCYYFISETFFAIVLLIVVLLLVLEVLDHALFFTPPLILSTCCFLCRLDC